MAGFLQEFTGHFRPQRLPEFYRKGVGRIIHREGLEGGPPGMQMARELGMNPNKLGKLDNADPEPWMLGISL
jgi:hypothetical protein